MLGAFSPKVKAALAEAWKNPQTYDVKAGNLGQPSVSVSGNEDWLTVAQCQAGWDGLANNETWYYKNHYSACQINANTVQEFTCDDTECRVTGQITMILAWIGSLESNTRSFKWTIYPIKFDSSGDPVDESRIFGIIMDCDTLDIHGSVCNQNIDEWDKTIAGWRRTTSVAFSYTTSVTAPPPGDPHPLDNISYYRFEPTTGTDSPEQIPPYPAVTVRCDNASYVGGAGCIFEGVFGNIHYDYNEPTTKESVQFVWTAMHHLDQVKPNSVGLYVPGGNYVQANGHKEPLHRNFYGTQSRSKVQAECRRLYGIDYTTRPGGGTNDCDEYPYAATYESANFDEIGTAATWAVKPVESGQNQRAGVLLGVFYRADHILDEDPFFVSIDNAPAN